MSISYPVSMPASPSFVSYTFHAVLANTMTSSPYSFSRQVQEYDGDAWMLEAKLPNMNRASAAPWFAFLASLQGVKGTFLAGDPICTTPQGTATGTPLVKGGSQTGNVLATDGWTAGVTNILKAGDYVSVDNYLYMVLKDVDSDGSGNATLDIFPSLRSSPADNATIDVTSPKGLFRLASNTGALYTVDARGAFQISFAAIEAV